MHQSVRTPLLARPEISRENFAPAGTAEFVRTFKGHSGAQVALYAVGRTSLVRKTAGSRAQNDRLMRQSAHQRELSACGLRFPRLLREGVDQNGVAFFEMEYIPARSLSAIVCEAAPLETDALVATLERALGLFRLTVDGTLPASLFHDKIHQILSAMDTSSHAEAIAGTARHLHAMDWSGIPSSLCHGDMTLENILVCPSKGVVFIDCDDDFAPSWWLDIAKLSQDTLGHWCMRDLYLASARGPDWLNARQRLERMAQIVNRLAARLDPQLPARLPQLAALHLLRTLPYIRNQMLLEFVLDRISQILKDSHA